MSNVADICDRMKSDNFTISSVNKRECLETH